LVEVNEEITRAYFEEVCGYLVRTGYFLKKTCEKRESNRKGGAGPADNDLMILHPNPTSVQYRDYVNKYGERAMISVKGWHMLPKRSRKEATAKRTIDEACVSFFGDPQASDTARDFFGGKRFNRVLVLSRLDENLKEIQKKHAKEKYKVYTIIEFQYILKKLLSAVTNRSYNPESQIMQTMFTLNKYVLNN